MYIRKYDPSNFHDVGRFHEKFCLFNTTYNEEKPQEVDPELLKFRAKFLLEELIEFLDATGLALINDGVHSVTIGSNKAATQGIVDDKAFDALLDLVYVAMGTAHLMGYPWQLGWDRVQRANMTKERAERADQSERGGTWDVIKPEGWEPPDIAGLLKELGWDTK